MLNTLKHMAYRVYANVFGQLSEHGTAEYFYLQGSEGFKTPPLSVKRAFTHPVIYACHTKICRAFASTPRVIYRIRRDEADKVTRTRAFDHPLRKLLESRPNPMMSAYTFWQVMMSWKLSHGNGCAEIVRDGFGRPLSLWPIPWTRIEPLVYQDHVHYRVSTDESSRIVFGDNMLHLKGHSTDGIIGLGLFDLMRYAAGLGLSMRDYIGGFYTSGGKPNAVIKRPKEAPKWSKRAEKKFMQDFNEFHSGSTSNRVALLQESMDITPLNITPHDAQTVENHKFSHEDICRFYDVPPHMVGLLDRVTFANGELMSRQFLDYTMEPHYVESEQELHYKLFTDREQAFYELDHDTWRLERGDSVTRWSNHEKALRIGVMNQDDIAEREGLNPLPDGLGSRYLIQLDKGLLENVGEQSNVSKNPPSGDIDGGDPNPDSDPDQ